MKKYILIIVLICLCFALSGCSNAVVKESYLGYEQEHKIIYLKYAIIKEYNNLSETYYLAYDIDTRIMYQIFHNGSRAGISEYYICKNNNPEIAIYGYNYLGE